MDLKFRVVFFCLAVIELTAADSVAHCPTNLRHVIAHGRSCYRFFLEQKLDFFEAEKTCKSHGWHLVTIRNDETQNFLYRTLRDKFNYNDVVWIGLSDYRTENRWVWIDGSRALYTHWIHELRGFLDMFEDCAGMDLEKHGYWKKYFCSDSFFIKAAHHFICERQYPKAKGVRTNPTDTLDQKITNSGRFPAELTAAESTEDCPTNLRRTRYLIAHGSSCYWFKLEQKLEFFEAEKTCKSHGGHLVTIRNAETQNFLYRTLRDEFHCNNVVWIGLSDYQTERRWVWMDGSRVLYTHWIHEQQGIMDLYEDCAGMDMDHYGYWKKYFCSDFLFMKAAHHFICEYPKARGVGTTTTIWKHLENLILSSGLLPAEN